MGRRRPYRKRERLIVPPPEDVTPEQLQAYVMRLQARAAGKALAPRPRPSLAEQRQAATLRQAEEDFVAGVAANRGRPLSERVPERSLDEIRARHPL